MSDDKRQFPEAAHGRKVWLWSQTELAKAIAVDPATVWRWTQDGCPYIPRSHVGGEHKYDLARVTDYLIATKLREAGHSKSWFESRVEYLAPEVERLRAEVDHLQAELAALRNGKS